jgi:antitoxin VapB
MSATTIRSKLFWSGGSQAVRLPKTMRLPGSEVVVSRKGKALVIAPAEDQDSWDGFWSAFEPLGNDGIRRWPTGPVEVRETM